MRRALGECRVTGIETNLGLLDALVASPDVRAGDYDTTFVERELGALLSRVPESRLSDHAVAAAAVALIHRRLVSETTTRNARELSPWVLVERAARFEK